MKISETMLCWNDKTKAVGVVPWPLSKGEDLLKNHGFYSDIGASSAQFRAMDTRDQVIALLSEGIFIAKDSGIPIAAVFDALCKVDECRKHLDPEDED